MSHFFCYGVIAERLLTMNGPEILRIVDAIHRDKSIDMEIVFEGIEQAILSAARKHFSEDEELIVQVDRVTGEPSLTCDGAQLDSDLLGDLLGRISAQTAKQVMIQRIREAERDAHYEEFLDLKSQIVSGSVTRVDRGTVIVNLGRVEAILPRSEQIHKETYRVGDRVRACVLDVRKSGSRVRVILSRTHADFVRRLFEVEIPEINDRVIEVRSIAREAGHRSKVAVSSNDTSVDCVGACVGVRGARIRGIVEELNSERIDIVRWNDSLQILVPNGLQPAEVEDVILCPMLGKVLVLVRDDQLSLAIGRRGQNVRLASKLVGWDINVMTQESLDEQLDISIAAFSVVPEMAPELVENLVSQGFFTFDDLSVIEPDQLADLGGLTQEQCDTIVDFADVESLRIEEEERLAEVERKRNPPPPPQQIVTAEPAADGDSLPKADTADADTADADTADADTADADTADADTADADT
ncbi:MAG: transcription termination factor NusA, partial [Planctomycetaceae bacterium]